MFDGKCSCIYCKEVRSAKGIHVHVDRTHLGSTKYSNGNNGKYHSDEYKQKLSVGSIEAANKRFGEKESRTEHCVKCNKEFEVSERPNQRKEKYFCSRSCANSHVVTEEHRRKVSKTNTGKRLVEYVSKTCVCGKSFEVPATSNKVYCNRGCRSKNDRLKRSALTNYRADAAFKFALKDYPDKFDFSLIETHGWYKPKNRGNNLTGISRDHIVSVRYGFDNNIPPEILGHPANCRLITHSENSSKHAKCDMTVGELSARILMWS